MKKHIENFSFWCAIVILSMILFNGLTDGSRHRGRQRSLHENEDYDYDEQNMSERFQLSMESHLENVRISFNETLTSFSHFMVKIFNISDKIIDQRNGEDQQCIKVDINANSFDDGFNPSGDWPTLEADDNTENSLQGLSTAQMISYFQDRYNNSDILPSVKESFIWISLTVNATEQYIANYNKSIPIVITTISDLEGKSFHLGQKLNISSVENSIRNETIRRMKSENATVTALLSNLKNRQNEELAKLQRLHVAQKSLVYDPSFLGVVVTLVPPILAVHENVKTTEFNIRGLVVEVKLSEMHLAKLQPELDTLLTEYEETEIQAEKDFAQQFRANSTLNETRNILTAAIDDGVKMKKVATFVTLLQGKLKVLYDVTASETPKDIIKAINVKDIVDYFEKDEQSGPASIVKELIVNETVINEFSRLIRSSRQADDESFCFTSSLKGFVNTPSELEDDETSPFRRKRDNRDIDSDINIGDQMLMNISDVYQTFRNGMTSPDDFQWNQLLSATATGSAVLSDLMVVAFSNPDIVLTRSRSFNPNKQHREKSGPESLRNILIRISHLQYNALIQYQTWMSQLQIMSLTLPDSLKTTIILLRALLGNPSTLAESSSEITQLISLQLNNTLKLTSENLLNQTFEIENSLQKLVDFATQFDGASIARKEQRHLYVSNRCLSAVNTENIYEKEFQESSISNLDGIQQMIDGWNNLIVSLRIITRTVKELVIPELEAFQYLVEWSVQLAIQRNQAQSDNESSALPLIHRLISQSAKASRAVYLLHETNSIYLKVSTRHLMPQTINLDEILALGHPLSAQDLAEKRRQIEKVGQHEKESIVELTNEAKRQMIVKLTEHEKVRQVDNGHQHCSFNSKVGHNDISNCVLGGGCDRYFLMSFLCA